MKETGDQLHQRVKGHTVALAIAMTSFLVLANVPAFMKEDFANPSTWRWFTIRMSVLALLLLFVIGASCSWFFRITLRLRRDPSARRAFYDDFHRQNELKAGYYGFIIALLAMGSLTILSVLVAAFTAILALQATMIISVLSFTGILLYLERD